MLTTQYASLVTYFYPLGNTPAVSLTQCLPLGERVDILSLGCGDLRHILFTLHTENRSIDITCCDIEAAVIARNVLLLSFIVDDVESLNVNLCWNLYYHFRIDETSLQLLQAQASKLVSLSTSIRTWHESKYGKRFRFCDHASLQKAHNLWSFYAHERTGKQLTAYKRQFEAGIQKSKQNQSQLGTYVNLTGIRSAFPVQSSAIMHLSTLHRRYWEQGTIDLAKSTSSRAVHPNPMFTSLNETAVLHYGTDPLLGFHLATANAPLMSNSPLFRSATDFESAENLVDAAKNEFCKWMMSFRKRPTDSDTLRFFIGDAIAFSYSLQHQSRALPLAIAKSYSDRFHYEALLLDGEDYATEGKASLIFDIIDTSNLIDHVGALNLLAAISPLLKNHVSATLYTEKLVQTDKTIKEMFDSLLCGSLTTISFLLGLALVEFATNTSSASLGDELFLHTVSRRKGDESSAPAQFFIRTAWKRPLQLHNDSATRNDIAKISFDPASLAQSLYCVYLKMFEAEDMNKLMSTLTMMRMQNLSLPRYHRASFAAFLCAVKAQLQPDWPNIMRILLDLIENNSSVSMTKNYIQELYLWLHLLDLYSVDTLKAPFNTSTETQLTGDIRDWKDGPPIMCITLKVPRAKLALFKSDEIKHIGTPPVHCIMQASAGAAWQWQNIFAAIQIGFGEVTVQGSRFSKSCDISIAEDVSGWTGSAPLLVSFYVPTWTLLIEPRAATVAFGIQSTPQTAMAYMGKLGLELNIFKATLADAEHVYFSQNLPNLASAVSVRRRNRIETTALNVSNPTAKTTITAVVDSSTGEVTSFISRVDILSEDFRASLRTGCQVRATSMTPFNFVIDLQDGPDFRVDFPIPVLESNIKTRIARKSSYIELITQVAAGSDWPAFSSFMYPVIQGQKTAVSWNMPYLNLKVLPIIDINKQDHLGWLNTHTALMFSPRERSLRDDTALPALTGERVRVELKDSLFSLFMHYSGLQGQRAHIFGITSPDAGGVHIILFVSKLRLDLSNRTVVLEAAVLPLYTELMPRITGFLQALTTSGKLCQVKASEAEMCLWKQVLPAWVERCRSWSHKPSCQYIATGKIPLSVERGDNPLCSCGNGILPSDFNVKVPKWEQIAKHVVHVAISPIFYSGTSEDLQNFGKVGGKRSKLADHPVSGCAVCGKEKATSGTSGGLLNCARCRRVKYCSKECQRADWKTHKSVCKE